MTATERSVETVAGKMPAASGAKAPFSNSLAMGAQVANGAPTQSMVARPRIGNPPPNPPAKVPQKPFAPPLTIDANAYPPAGPSRLALRHKILGISFLLCVVLPCLFSAFYLWFRAADQYASSLAFSVQNAEGQDPLALLSGITSLTGAGTTPDTDIIYNYIYSQQMVADVQKELDIAAIWSRPDHDPWYSYDSRGSIEDLHAYWKNMVSVNYDSITRLIEVRVLAFNGDDANRIAWAIFEQSSLMINRLNDASNRDALRHAQNELETQESRALENRQKIIDFRNKYQMVDPIADLESRSTVTTTLETELAQALIQLDLLTGTTAANDPRIKALSRRIEVVETRLAAEKLKLGAGEVTQFGLSMAEISGEYEALMLEREFHEARYGMARAAYEAALAELPRKTRYLSAHMLPTLPESSRFPQRPETLAILTIFLLMAWSIAVLLFYSVRDRR